MSFRRQNKKNVKNGQVNYWRVIERQPRKQFAQSFYCIGDFE